MPSLYINLVKPMQATLVLSCDHISQLNSCMGSPARAHACINKSTTACKGCALDHCCIRIDTAALKMSPALCAISSAKLTRSPVLSFRWRVVDMPKCVLREGSTRQARCHRPRPCLAHADVLYCSGESCSVKSTQPARHLKNRQKVVCILFVCKHRLIYSILNNDGKITMQIS